MSFSSNKAEYQRIRYHHHEGVRERHIEAVRRWQRKNPIKYWASKTIQSHKRKGFKVLLTTTELHTLAKSITHCSFCGIELDYNPKGRSGWHRNSPSMDRIDNKKVIAMDDIQIICAQCNSAKSTMSIEEFIEYCQTIVEKHRSNRNV